MVARPRTLVAFAAAAAALAACERTAPPRRIESSLIAIDHERVVVRTDVVGVDRFASRATFVIVDAQNRGDRDAEVTLGGVLVDADGQEVGTLRPESLHIPRRARRTFALVDRDRAERKTATAARVDLRGAREPRFADPITITNGHIYPDGDRVVVVGMVKNTSDRACIAMVLAGFHDRDGRPMTRPFAAFELGAGAERPARFVGPDGSHAGYLFVGEITYCPRTGCDVEHVVPTL
jgi:hypothetical protein